jgi:hypothetical protein
MYGEDKKEIPVRNFENPLCKLPKKFIHTSEKRPTAQTSRATGEHQVDGLRLNTCVI